MLVGPTLALQYGMMHLERNMDSLQLLHLLNSPLFHDSHVYKEQNELADVLVVVTITTTLMDDNTLLFWNSPASLTNILQADKNGELYSRRVQSISYSNRSSMFNTSSTRQVVHTSSASLVVSVVPQPQLMTL